MTHYRAQPEDDAVLIVLCAVRDGQFGKSALNEVIDLWVAGQIGRVEALEVIAGANENTMCASGRAKRSAGSTTTGDGGPSRLPMSVIERCSCGKPLDDCAQRMLALVQERDTWKRRCVEDTARLREVVRHERDNLRGAVDERDRLREVLRAVLMEPDPIKRNQLAAPVLTTTAGQ
jgi:hypothetical protein